VPDLQLTFVGGIDRADAALVAAAIGATPAYAAVPVELEFHCAPRGIPDLLEGRITLAGFRDAIAERWWSDRLEKIAAPQQLDEALKRLAAGYERDPVGACRGLFCDLAVPVAERAGRPGLVERSVGNLVHAPTLERLFADARFVHAVRDGRDVAARELPHGRSAGELLAGVERWAERVRAIDASVRVREDGAIYGVWPERLAVVVLGPGGEAFAGLRAFLDLEDDPPAPTALEPDRAPGPVSEWKHGLSRRERRRVARRYARTLRALADDGIHCAPALIEVRESAGR
jgi:hypothetical protein